MEEQIKRLISKSHNHHHFWVEDNILCETYKTIRGLRFRELVKVEFPDKEILTDADIQVINKKLF